MNRSDGGAPGRSVPKSGFDGLFNWWAKAMSDATANSRLFKAMSDAMTDCPVLKRIQTTLSDATNSNVKLGLNLDGVVIVPPDKEGKRDKPGAPQIVIAI